MTSFPNILSIRQGTLFVDSFVINLRYKYSNKLKIISIYFQDIVIKFDGTRASVYLGRSNRLTFYELV